MTIKSLKTIILLLLTVCCITLVFTLPPIKQDPTYHHFADNREILDVSNFYNVVSNLPFLILGLGGLYFFFKEEKLTFTSVAIPMLCVGVVGIGLGSAYYHYNPNNTTLVWDRVPMTITFMAFFSVIISTHIDKRWGSILLFPLLIIGVFSVINWYTGELNGEGDLRLYGLVQFYPMVAIPIILLMYTTPRAAKLQIVMIIVFYAVAKFFERMDGSLFNLGEIISGHSMKHLFAAVSIFLILKMVRKKTAH